MEVGSNNGETCDKTKDGSCHAHTEPLTCPGCHRVETMVISKNLEALA